jgi:hypothetical protein
MKITFPFYMMLSRELNEAGRIPIDPKVHGAGIHALARYVDRIQQAPRLVLASTAPGKSGIVQATVSIQASEMHYCSPRENLHWHLYSSYELGFPSNDSKLLTPYGEMDSDMGHLNGIYNRVPRDIVQLYIKEQGGIIGYITDPASTDFVPFTLSEEEISYYILNCG